MKTVIIGTLLLFFGFTSQAEEDNQFTLPELRQQVFESLDSCDQAVFSNDQYMAVSMNQGLQLGRKVKVISLRNRMKALYVETSSRIADVKIEAGVVYVLTSRSLEAWDIASEQKLFSWPTRPDLGSVVNWRKAASGFVLQKGRAIISHSVMGLTVMDLKTGQFLKLIKMPTISSAQDITLLNDQEALVAVDNDAEATFRGIYVLNLATLQVTKQIKVDNAFSSSIRVLPGNRLMLNFFNAIWKFELDKVLNATSEPKPIRRAWVFPGLYLVDMVGKVQFDEKNIYACFRTMNKETGEREVKPLAFALEPLKL
jgi:hypothetical protein